MSVEGALTPARLRLICNGMELTEGSSLQECRVPVRDHPTPVNLMIRPASAVGGGGGTVGGAAPEAGGGGGGGGCCSVS